MAKNKTIVYVVGGVLLISLIVFLIIYFTKHDNFGVINRDQKKLKLNELFGNTSNSEPENNKNLTAVMDSNCVEAMITALVKLEETAKAFQVTVDSTSCK